MRLFIILLTTLLYADDISYSFNLNNQTPYKKEAIVLDVNLTQQDHNSVMFFKFSPKKSENYTFKQIDFKEYDEYHDLRHQYRYLIYPLKAGNVNISFSMIKSITTDASVAYAISGDRDNVKGLVKKDIEVKLKPIPLDVKPLPKDTTLVGDFRLDYTIDKNSTKAYEPIYLHIELKGNGYLEPIVLIPKSEDYNIFMEKPIVKKGAISYDYAISGDNNFTIPKIDLKAFNPKSKTAYNLIVPAHTIKVDKIDNTTLLDNQDSPKELKRDIDWSWIGWILSYIAVFTAGFLTPRDIFKRRVIKKDTIEDEIASTKSHKELLKLLLSKNSTRYSEAIKKLESAIYRGENIKLSKIKKELI